MTNTAEKFEIIAGELPNGEFTFVNSAAGTRRTVKIKTQAPDANFQPGARLVSVLTGSNNEEWGDWTTVGTVTAEGGFKPFRKHEGGQLAKISAWAVKVLQAPEAPEGVEVHKSCRCLRCNRLLTVPSSINRYLGPECAKHV